MIFIHRAPGGFSDRWIRYCEEQALPFSTCDLFADDTLARMRRGEATTLLAHPPMASAEAKVAAQSLVHAIEFAGFNVFPTVADFWHFDDKIAQHYWFVATGVASPETRVFTSRAPAHAWLATARFPQVFKLRAGAGSTNVKLVRSHAEAERLIKRMFGRGMTANNAALNDLRNRARVHRAKGDFTSVLRRLPQTIATIYRSRRDIAWERGYVYFQEFIAENEFDTRVTIIGNRAFAFRRMNRPGDFRASGSGLIDYNTDRIDLNCIKNAFDAARSLGSTCMAFDFVHQAETKLPLLLEMSYGFRSDAVFACPGHWTADLDWISGHQWPEDLILRDTLARTPTKRNGIT